LTKDLKVQAPIYFAEIGVDMLLALLPKEKRTQNMIPYPGSERDWTLTLPDSTPIGDLLQAVKTHKSSLLEDVYLLDLYKSSQIGKDRKNVTLRFFYRDSNQTIGQTAVDQEHMRVTQIVAELFHLPS
jgi:phenylalanyl-tRNA synthetase beta chain